MLLNRRTAAVNSERRTLKPEFGLAKISAD